MAMVAIFIIGLAIRMGEIKIYGNMQVGDGDGNDDDGDDHEDDDDLKMGETKVEMQVGDGDERYVMG